MWQPSDTFEIPLDTWVETAIKGWLVPNFRDVFQAIQVPITVVLEGLDAALQAIPMPVFAIAVALIAWAVASRGLALFSLVSLAIVDLIGLWTQTMTTLAMILTAVLFCAIVGVPLGIAAARRDGFEKGLRPVLDIMQTIPPFVYLVPIVMLFGVGMAPGIIATIIFALPPIIRLTNLGIRSVPEDLIEAAFAFGSSPRQVLWEVQLPLALRTIMAGLNQTLMLALSMAVIAALIGAGGLGLTVYTGLGRLDVGSATEGGLGIVLLAMILDRITQALGSDAPTKSPGFLETLKSFFRLGAPAKSPESGQRVP